VISGAIGIGGAIFRVVDASNPTTTFADQTFSNFANVESAITVMKGNIEGALQDFISTQLNSPPPEGFETAGNEIVQFLFDGDFAADLGDVPSSVHDVSETLRCCHTAVHTCEAELTTF
jgi:hypothetical protein